MDVVMPVKIPRENDAKMFRTQDNVDCFIFNAEHASFMLVDEVIIFVFAWPKRPRQEIAQFSAEVTASWSGDSDTSWLCW